jgi:hypothetical protein
VAVITDLGVAVEKDMNMMVIKLALAHGVLMFTIFYTST